MISVSIESNNSFSPTFGKALKSCTTLGCQGNMLPRGCSSNHAPPMAAMTIIRRHDLGSGRAGERVEGIIRNRQMQTLD